MKIGRHHSRKRHSKMVLNSRNQVLSAPRLPVIIFD
jgi:hypothetical protein